MQRATRLDGVRDVLERVSFFLRSVLGQKTKEFFHPTNCLREGCLGSRNFRFCGLFCRTRARSAVQLAADLWWIIKVNWAESGDGRVRAWPFVVLNQHIHQLFNRFFSCPPSLRSRSSRKLVFMLFHSSWLNDFNQINYLRPKLKIFLILKKFFKTRITRRLRSSSWWCSLMFLLPPFEKR